MTASFFISLFITIAIITTFYFIAKKKDNKFILTTEKIFGCFIAGSGMFMCLFVIFYGFISLY